MKKVIYLILIVLPGLNLAAQTVYKDQVRIENQSVVRHKEQQSLIVSMDVIMQANLKLTSNHAAVFTPMLEGEGHSRALPAIVVHGRKRSLIERRNHRLPQDAYATIRRERKAEQKVAYLVQIPFEEWMKRANLVMDADLCGCRNAVEANSLEPIATLNLIPPKPQPRVAYIIPQEVMKKERSVANKAYLDFPVNKTVIDPNYRGNDSELARIRAVIDSVKHDKFVTITQIRIKGFASPEGAYSSNARLALGRANSLMNYVRDYYHLSPSMFQVTSMPEDWEGFRRFVETSSMDKKEEILEIMNHAHMDYDRQEAEIRARIGREASTYLLEQCYPALRRSDYEVAYTIRPFTVEEVKELIVTNPKYLSLQEICLAAQTYEPGSEKFDEAFQVAVTMFPEDATANLNAAALEIRRGDLVAARDYLSRADQTKGATLNNWAVIALLEGDLAAAANYLKRAKEAACPEAAVNQIELDKQLE